MLKSSISAEPSVLFSQVGLCSTWRDPRPPTHPSFIKLLQTQSVESISSDQTRSPSWRRAAIISTIYFSLLFCLKEIATRAELLLRIEVPSNHCTKTQCYFKEGLLQLMYCVQIDPSSRNMNIAPPSRDVIFFSRQDVAWCKWLFVINWLFHTTIDWKSLRLPMGEFCVEEQHTVSSCVSEAAEEPLGHHSDKILSRAAGWKQGFFL